MFTFTLAEHLHMTAGQVEDMPHAEYAAWASYLKVKNIITEQKVRHGN